MVLNMINEQEFTKMYGECNKKIRTKIYTEKQNYQTEARRDFVGVRKDMFNTCTKDYIKPGYRGHHSAIFVKLCINCEEGKGS